MKVKIAGGKSSSMREFREVIERAAEAAGIADDQMLLYATHLFETLGNQVARGRIVTIPGFGKFAACLVKHFRHPKGSMRPRFSSAVGFMQQTKLCAPYSTAGNKALLYHQRNHGVESVRMTARVARAAEGIRASIKAQMAQD